ncbi:hypothetical protein FRC06_008854 [Ceratobasidium sp. 370]|nr:hypothetical protein FRC06_008854 [Ceratobasidium sp. 370]
MRTVVCEDLLKAAELEEPRQRRMKETGKLFVADGCVSVSARFDGVWTSSPLCIYYRIGIRAEAGTTAVPLGPASSWQFAPHADTFATDSNIGAAPSCASSPVTPPHSDTPICSAARLLTPASLVTPSSGFHGRTPRAPSWRANSASPISAQQKHMHALALQSSESVMGALVYRLVDELSLSGDENEQFGTKQPIFGGPDPATLQSVRGTNGLACAREAMVMRGGMSVAIAAIGWGI